MIPKSFPSPLSPQCKLFSTSITPLIFHNNIPYTKSKCHHQHILFKSVNLPISSFRKNHQKLQPVLVSGGSNYGDNRAMETVLRLYEAIKNKNLNEMSEIIGQDCLCVCGFVSKFKTFSGKKQVIEFFSSLMGNLGNKFEFVVQPTLHDGMTVGVSWKLGLFPISHFLSREVKLVTAAYFTECSKTHKPIGRGFSFHMCHIYEGKVLIRNVEMFLEPLLNIEPARLKMVGLVASIMGQMTSQAILKGDKKKAAYVVIYILILLVMLFIVVKLYTS